MLLENPTDRLDFKEVLSQLSVLEKDEREKAQKSKKYNELLKKYEQVCASLEATKNYIKDCDSMDRFLRILMSLILPCVRSSLLLCARVIRLYRWLLHHIT